MSTTSTQPVAPFALQPGEGDARWFLGALGVIKAAPETTGGELAVIEFLWPAGRRLAAPHPPERGRVVLRDRG